MKPPNDIARELVDHASDKPDENLPIERFIALFTAHLVQDIAKAIALERSRAKILVEALERIYSYIRDADQRREMARQALAEYGEEK